MGLPFYDQGQPEFAQRPDDPEERGRGVRPTRPPDVSATD